MMNPDGYRGYGTLAAFIMTSFILISARGTHRHIPDLHNPPPPQPFSIRRTVSELRETLLLRPFLALFFAAVVAALGQGVITSLSIHFISIGILSRYRITREGHAENVKTVRERRKQPAD